MELDVQSKHAKTPIPAALETRIVIVEDQGGVADSLTKLINRVQGLRVVAAYRDGETALAQIPHQSPDVVLMDIGLPGMSGIQCVRALKAILPLLPIVILTVYDEGE